MYMFLSALKIYLINIILSSFFRINIKIPMIIMFNFYLLLKYIGNKKMSEKEKICDQKGEQKGKHIRQLKITDYKSYIYLLSQLTDVGNMSYEIFKKRFDEINNVLGKNLFIYVIVDEDVNELIAAGTLIIEPKFIHKCSKLGHIEDVVVNKKYRGKQFGVSIVDHLVCVAKRVGCYKVRLVCSEKNTFFYEKCRFVTEGVEMVIRTKL